MERKDDQKFLKINDAVTLVSQEINLIGIVVKAIEPKHSRGPDWVCSVWIIDESYPRPGLCVNVFTSELEELPHVKNLEDMILLTRVKIETFDGDRVTAVFNKRASSFALYEEGYDDDDDFLCYQHSSRFQDRAQYKNSMDYLGRWFTGSKTNTGPTNFSFLREIKGGNYFDLACRILHVNENRSVIFVWDGTDTPPTSVFAVGGEDEQFSSLHLCNCISRDALLELPTVGTRLRVSAHNRFPCMLKAGQWVKLCGLLCEVDRGNWVGKCMDTTKVKRIQDDSLAENIKRTYDKRISSNLGLMPFWSFPWPPGLTETDHDRAPFVTLMDILTFPEVERFYSSKSRRYRVILTLEDPTAILKAFLCDEEADKFWGGHHGVEILRKKRNRLLGIRETENGVDGEGDPRNPPWIECCIRSYYTDKTDPWKTRYYRIFDTRLVV
ncbi:PREDICTED: protection of telomeres protein 1a isoform X2 [Tarenaya hassleriana]|uniref:protection of telomeres protein 1a isoform X2 n=1 Tax=Tarenaya hassleriana TaxID=28532 RepID=UPI00053C9F0A|nr:PREDICTED: protection of telomeres protein 1a isoform X2 [Tarenaya hassleriana]